MRIEKWHMNGIDCIRFSYQEIKRNYTTAYEFTSSNILSLISMEVFFSIIFLTAATAMSFRRTMSAFNGVFC